MIHDMHFARSRLVSWLLVVAAFAGYVLAFPWLHHLIGRGALPLVGVPVMLAGGVFGMRVALCASLSALPLASLLLASMNDAGLRADELGGCAALILVGLIMGRMSDLGRQLKLELAQRTRAEHDLRSRETLLRSVTEKSPLAFFVVDNRTDAILYFNHHLCQLWGVEHLEEHMRQGLLKNNDILADCAARALDGPAFAASCQPLQDAANRDVIEDEIPFCDGRVIRRFSAQIREDNDAYFGRLHLFEDVTERKQAELALKASRDELEQRVARRTSELKRINAELEAALTAGRLKEEALQHRAAAEHLVSRISTQFINLPADELDHGIIAALQAICEVVGADCCHAYLVSDDGKCLQRAYSWVASSLELGATVPEEVVLDPAPSPVTQLFQTHRAQVLSTTDLPDGAGQARAALQAMGARASAFVPLIYAGAPVGVLAFGLVNEVKAGLEADLPLLQTMGEIIVNALQHRRADEALRRSEERRFKAIVTERERISRELHDGTAQVLGYVNTKAQAAEALLEAGKPDEARQQMAQLARAARETYVDVREAILGLRLTGKGDRTMVEMLRDYCGQIGQFSQTRVTVEATSEAEALALPPEVEVQVVRIAQEALTNIRKHAAATRASVRLQVLGDNFIMRIEDNGRGFNQQHPAHDNEPHFGLKTMQERAESVGGQMQVRSAPGQGALITVSIPVKSTSGFPLHGV